MGWLTTIVPLPDAPSASEPNELLVWALVVVVIALASTLVFTVRGYKKVQKIDKAVNNVGPNEASLIETVKTIDERVDRLITDSDRFKEKGWASLPEDLDSSAHLTETVRGIQSDIREVFHRIQVVIERLEHVDTKIERHLADERHFRK